MEVDGSSATRPLTRNWGDLTLLDERDRSDPSGSGGPMSGGGDGSTCEPREERERLLVPGSGLTAGPEPPGPGPGPPGGGTSTMGRSDGESEETGGKLMGLSGSEKG